MAEDELIRLLDQGIDRLATGETVDQIVVGESQGATLRLMLEAGLLTRRARFTPTEINAAMTRLDARVLREINATGGGFPYWSIGLIVVLGLVVIVAVSLSNSATVLPTRIPTQTDNLGATSLPLSTSAPALPAPITLSGALAQTEAGVWAIQGLPIDVTQLNEIPLLEVGAVVEVTGKLQGGQVIAESLMITSATATAPNPSASIVVIEGTVQNIAGNQIQILDQTFTLPTDDPHIQAIQVGDVLRLEGELHGTMIQIRQILFISVEVVVNMEGQIWRDTGDCQPLPAWITPAQVPQYMSRCSGNQPPVTNQGGGGGGGQQGDDDD